MLSLCPLRSAGLARALRRLGWAVLSCVLLAACAGMDAPTGPPRPERLHVLTDGHELLTVMAARPQEVVSRTSLRGLAPGERVLGIDYRVAYGVLYALGSSGRIYTLDPRSGALAPLGDGPFPLGPQGATFGFDFNPSADRIRIVSDAGLNLRAHPVSGALVDADPSTPGVQPDGALRYAPGDVQAGRMPRIVAAAYTYNQRDDKLTTNFAIDAERGTLVRQGSVEGEVPVVSPNTGLLYTVGPLGTGALARASFDIADVSNAALAAVSPRGIFGAGATQLVLIDLASGRAQRLGRLADGAPVLGLAIEP